MQLDDQLIRQLGSVARPALRDATVVFLGDGCDHLNYLVDDTQVLRVPKDESVAPRLATEVALLQYLDDMPVVIPRPEGPFHCPAYPFVFSLYEYIPGTPGDRVAHLDRAHAARVIGHTLARLHTCDVAQISSLGLTTETDAVHQWRAQVERDLDAIAELRGRIPARWLDIEHLQDPHTHCLVHNDLWGEHVLVDDAGRVTAIIDWADAVIGDPAMDYAGVLAWLGQDFLAQALECGGIDKANRSML